MWAKDKLEGTQGELKVAAMLASRGEPVLEIASDRFPDYDLRTARGTYEVKWDRLAHRTYRTFIETSYNGIPSGLYGTKADYFIILIGNSAWEFKTRDFREWFQKHIGIEGITDAQVGDGKKSGGYFVATYLLPKIWSAVEHKLT